MIPIHLNPSALPLLCYVSRAGSTYKISSVKLYSWATYKVADGSYPRSSRRPCLLHPRAYPASIHRTVIPRKGTAGNSCFTYQSPGIRRPNTFARSASGIASGCEARLCWSSGWWPSALSIVASYPTEVK